MARRPTQRIRRHRAHGAVLQQSDRRELERDGWRTTLEYRENHVRARSGRLLYVHEEWRAEAERDPGSGQCREPGFGVDVIAASGSTADAAWKKLRIEAELADVRVAIPDGRRRARAS